VSRAWRVAVRGAGGVELPAYGLADAEHRVEKELTALWPEARAEVVEVSRAGSGRIVEEMGVRYRVRGGVSLAARSAEDAGRGALRELRARFAGSRYARVAWEVERVEEVAG
jgi:hypothetical protein